MGPRVPLSINPEQTTAFRPGKSKVDFILAF
jgi:hypothetical protein